MATGNDTIVLDAASVPRVKRVKTESTGLGVATPFVHHDVTWVPSNEVTPPIPTHQQRSRSVSQRVSSPQEQRTEARELRKNKTPSLRLRLSRQDEHEQRSPRPAPPPSTKSRLIDFDYAPSDPHDFIWWFAQQVAQMSDGGSGTNGTGSLPDFSEMTSIMRPMSLQLQGLDGVSGMAREKEREKQRVDNRERKKRWRETNAERNKDNDLRCRVTKLAKARFGAEESDEKVEFIEREFEIRRAKRAEKEKRNASYRGTLSAFRAGSSMCKDLKEELRYSLSGSTKAGVAMAGAHLIDMLVDAAGLQLTEEALRSAQNLQESLASGATDASAVEEAARILAGNEDLRRALEGGLVDGKDSAEPESSMDEYDDPRYGNGHLTKDTTPADNSEMVEESQPQAVATKLADATGSLILAAQTLDGMSKPAPPSMSRPVSKKVRTAAARRSDMASSATPVPKRRGRPPKKKRTAKNAALSKALDTKSIDALLALANGGSILDTSDSDTDDDATIPDHDELLAADMSFFDATSDTALNDILERVATRIVQERLEKEGFKAKKGSPFDGDAFRTHAVREQVLKLKAFLSEAGVEVNTLVPRAQAQALSELYAHLRKYIERESTPLGEATVGGMSANGEAWSTYRQPGSDRPTGGQQPISGAPNPPQTAIAGSSALAEASSNAHRSPEEQRKIKTFGFPPLPGGVFFTCKRGMTK